MEKYSLLFYKSSSGREVIGEFIADQDLKTQLKIRNGMRLLSEYGLKLLRTKWIKKIHTKPDLFEFRIKSRKEIRLIFGNIKNVFVILNIFIKKKQKLPREELKIAISRIKEFIS